MNDKKNAIGNINQNKSKWEESSFFIINDTTTTEIYPILFVGSVRCE